MLVVTNPDETRAARLVVTGYLVKSTLYSGYRCSRRYWLSTMESRIGWPDLLTTVVSRYPLKTVTVYSP